MSVPSTSSLADCNFMAAAFPPTSLLDAYIPMLSGTKHRGLKPGQRKELMASAKEEAQNLQKGIKKAVKST